MKILKKFIFVLMIILIHNNIFAGSYYYYSEFTNINEFNQDWLTNWKYGMEGLTADPSVEVSNSSYFASSTGNLILRGIPYIACIGSVSWCYNGYWTAYAALFTNRKFSASATQPFGFELVRTRSVLDAYNGGNNPYRNSTQLDIWLVRDDGSVTNHRATYPGYLCLYENAREGESAADQNGSYWGFFDGTKHWIDFSTSTDAYGNQINLSNSSIHSLNWTYDYWNTPIPNTNHYGIKIVHDGQYISMYINPDPDDNDAYPNEYCLVARREVLWNDNLTMIIGHEVRNQDMPQQDADYDFIKIKSVANKSKVLLDPKYLDNEEKVECVLYLSNDITPKNAGINYIEVHMPDGLKLEDDLFKCITVKDFYNNGKEMEKLKNRVFAKKLTETLKPNEVGIIRKSDNKIAIILGTQITNMADSKKEDISIGLKLKVKDKFKSGFFNVFVEARQFDKLSQSWNRDSTCGLQKCTGNTFIYRIKEFIVKNDNK